MHSRTSSLFVQQSPPTENQLYVESVTSRDVRETEIRFGFGYKNQTVQKFYICSDGFPIETACNPPFK